MRGLSSVLIVLISCHEVLTCGDASNLDEPCAIRIVVDQSSVIKKIFVYFQNNSGNRREYVSNSLYRLNITKWLACNYLIIYLREVNEYASELVKYREKIAQEIPKERKMRFAICFCISMSVILLLI